VKNPWLPVNESGNVRPPDEVALRALALFAVVVAALDNERPAVEKWLTTNGLWSALAPSELAFLNSTNPTRQQLIDASWLPERLVVLIWALGGIPGLPPADELCDPASIQGALPTSAAADTGSFVARASLRPEADLVAMADEILNLHWEARDATLNGRPSAMPVNLDIIQERHHAINWVIGHAGLPWDEVTTDT
jgi:hypothetical protein